MTATHPFHSRILLTFDFDWTLAADSFESLVSSLGLNVADWRTHDYYPLAESGWDDILAKVEGLRRSCARAGIRVDLDTVAKAGAATRGFRCRRDDAGAIAQGGRSDRSRRQAGIRHRLLGFSRPVWPSRHRRGFRPRPRFVLRRGRRPRARRQSDDLASREGPLHPGARQGGSARMAPTARPARMRTCPKRHCGSRSTS